MQLEKVKVKQTIGPPDTHRQVWLMELVKWHGWTHGAELGLLKGETFFFLLRHCPGLHMIGVDLWAEQPDNPGIETYTQMHYKHEYWAEVVTEMARGNDRARIIRDYTVEAAKQVDDGSLDFVFIDADHCRVAADIEAWRPKLKPGGKLCGHDINWLPVKNDVDRLIVDYDIGPNQCWLEK